MISVSRNLGNLAIRAHLWQFWQLKHKALKIILILIIKLLRPITSELLKMRDWQRKLPWPEFHANVFCQSVRQRFSLTVCISQKYSASAQIQLRQRVCVSCEERRAQTFHAVYGKWLLKLFKVSSLLSTLLDNYEKDSLICVGWDMGDCRTV